MTCSVGDKSSSGKIYDNSSSNDIDDDEDSIDLDSIFKLLDTPVGNSRSTAEEGVGHHQPSDTGTRESVQDNSDDVDIDALLGSIISTNGSVDKKTPILDEKIPKQQRQQKEQRSNGSEDDDAMKEFERILSDMAMRKEAVYKQRNERPGPLFWQERGLGKEGQDFIKELGPETLFKRGPRASAYSANKLAGDMSMVSALAKRVGKKSANEANVRKAMGPRRDAKDAPVRVGQVKRWIDRRGATNYMSGQLGKRDMELEQVLLSRLANCTSATRLSSFVYDEIEGNNAAKIRGIQDALPSPVVCAEVIRKARELGVPLVGFYVFRHCRSFIDVMSKTRVLNADVYEELLVTAWGAMRDPAAAAFIIRDAITMGVAASASMTRYIDQIILELRTSYTMDAAAARLVRLKKGLDPAFLEG
ncbi:hypothetical protein IW140_002157 [Coemansia sp. RSA 1813]|nr:hypothetical protein LPJ74_003390 [Coemansia sp. RSA 1843]KAJ2090202.1 hypothetical protein IW138_002834 [Coemansia sp. RSA 986]KAJ2570731.1 hypothetical protein IW140_002157 [Coemansia sp. RSA 1813]